MSKLNSTIIIDVSAMFLSILPLFRAQAADRPAAGRPRPPNIVFIMADDLGYGDLGCYGQQRIKTPGLDRMASEGVRFTQWYAGSTVCTPSRCALMTGLHTGHSFLRSNGGHDLRPQDVTVAEALKDAGYETALIGKWGLGDAKSDGTPNRQGFDYFFGYLDNVHAHNYYPPFLWRNADRVPLKNVVPDARPSGAGVATERVQYSQDLFTEEALAYLDRAKTGHAKPFFLYLAYTTPHANNEAKNKGMEVPDLGEYANTDWPEPQKGHAAMITRLDRDIGRVLDKLKELGMEQNTVVFFTSDNGPHKEGGNDPLFNHSNGPFRGWKRDLTEGGIRVPMIVRWPGVTPAGVTCDYVGYPPDFIPTAMELAGAEAPKGLDGLSAVPSIRGQAERQQAHAYLYWEFYERVPAQAARIGDWKGIRQPFPVGRIQVYDLKSDPGETNDVAGENVEVMRAFEARMNEAHKAPEDGSGSAPPPRPAAQRARQ
jgi:uncharacterized sulfatase